MWYADAKVTTNHSGARITETPYADAKVNLLTTTIRYSYKLAERAIYDRYLGYIPRDNFTEMCSVLVRKQNKRSN